MKVLDFGLAKAMEPRDALGGRGRQCRRRSRRPRDAGGHDSRHRSLHVAGAGPGSGGSPRGHLGVWVCLYEMLTGLTIFARTTTTETIAAVLEREVDWSRLPASTPASVRRLLKRCLEKDPRHRLRDAADARLELQDAGSEDGPTVRRSISNLQLAGIALLAVVVIVAAAALTLPRGRGPAAPSFSHVVRLTTGRRPRRRAAALYRTGNGSPTSRTRGTTNVWVKFIAGGEPVNLTAAGDLEIGIATGIGGLGISPDGTQIAVPARARGSSDRFATWTLPSALPRLPHKLLDAGQLAHAMVSRRTSDRVRGCAGSASGDRPTLPMPTAAIAGR